MKLFFQGESVEKDEAEFHRMLKKKAEDDGGKLKVVDVSKKESEIEAKEIMSLTEVIAGVKEKFPGLNHVRIPICNSANPLDRDFDALCATLVGSNVNCPVIVNCQVLFNYLKMLIFARAGQPEGPKNYTEGTFSVLQNVPSFSKKNCTEKYFFLS